MKNYKTCQVHSIGTTCNTAINLLVSVYIQPSSQELPFPHFVKVPVLIVLYTVANFWVLSSLSLVFQSPELMIQFLSTCTQWQITLCLRRKCLLKGCSETGHHSREETLQKLQYQPPVYCQKKELTLWSTSLCLVSMLIYFAWLPVCQCWNRTLFILNESDPGDTEINGKIPAHFDKMWTLPEKFVLIKYEF